MKISLLKLIMCEKGADEVIINRNLFVLAMLLLTVVGPISDGSVSTCLAPHMSHQEYYVLNDLLSHVNLYTTYYITLGREVLVQSTVCLFCFL